MQIFRTTPELQQWRRSLSERAHVAFVPTMGYLHAGHVSLIEAGHELAAHQGPVVVSIFVNPTQFGPNEDFAAYPRNEAADLAICERAGVHAVFLPTSPQEIYQPESSTWVNVDGLDQTLCGASRPGHFRGVCTVVTKLWQLVLPRWGIFGKKDFQQLAILRRLHRDLFLPGEIVGMPIVRESDGLALSSRNARLSTDARGNALAISRFLATVSQRFAAGETRRDQLLANAQALMQGGEIDYVQLVDAESLQPIETVGDAPALVAVAAFFGGVRLIDNLELNRAFSATS